MSKKQIDSLLLKASKERELAKPVQALEIFNKVLLLAQKEHNHERAIQVFADRAIVYRHMFEDTGDVLFAVLARKDAETMFELVKTWGVSERLHTAYYLLGQGALLFQDYSDAENYFYKSLRYFKGNLSEKGSWRYHWAKALYMTGEKKKALLAFAQAINEIIKNKNSVNDFLYKVYLSGAYANYAFVLAKEKMPEAKKYYGLAKDIIRSDKRLVVRKKQWQELEKIFKKLGVS